MSSVAMLRQRDLELYVIINKATWLYVINTAPMVTFSDGDAQRRPRRGRTAPHPAPPASTQEPKPPAGSPTLELPSFPRSSPMTFPHVRLVQVFVLCTCQKVVDARLVGARDRSAVARELVDRRNRRLCTIRVWLPSLNLTARVGWDLLKFQYPSMPARPGCSHCRTPPSLGRSGMASPGAVPS